MFGPEKYCHYKKNIPFQWPLIYFFFSEKYIDNAKFSSLTNFWNLYY